MWWLVFFKIIIAVVFGEFDMDFFFGTTSLWLWVLAVGFAGNGLCVMVVLASCYCFKEETQIEEYRERDEA